MDKEQQRRFREAVDRKQHESEAATQATQTVPPGAEGEPSQPQDTFSAREKSTRHKKVTADKWNQ